MFANWWMEWRSCHLYYQNLQVFIWNIFKKYFEIFRFHINDMYIFIYFLKSQKNSSVLTNSQIDNYQPKINSHCIWIIKFLFEGSRRGEGRRTPLPIAKTFSLGLCKLFRISIKKRFVILFTRSQQSYRQTAMKEEYEKICLIFILGN